MGPEPHWAADPSNLPHGMLMQCFLLTIIFKGILTENCTSQKINYQLVQKVTSILFPGVWNALGSQGADGLCFDTHRTSEARTTVSCESHVHFRLTACSGKRNCPFLEPRSESPKLLLRVGEQAQFFWSGAPKILEIACSGGTVLASGHAPWTPTTAPWFH